MKKKVVVFTGAGISAESGIATFRENGGTWDTYNVEDVATKDGWRKNKKLVLEFYNKRRAELKTVEPNDAHRIVAELEKHYDVTVVTQNVDNLHERGGSSYVLHLHGELNKVRSTQKPSIVLDWTEDLNIGDKCEKGSQLRPHIVWFGEPLDKMVFGEAMYAIETADIFIVVGTSMLVEPAASLYKLTKDECVRYYVDPNLPIKQLDPDRLSKTMSDLGVNDLEMHGKTFKHVKMNATLGMRVVADDLSV